MHAFVYLLEQAGRVYGDKFGLAAGLRCHTEQLWCMGRVLCILKVCQDNVQPGEVRVRLPSQGLICHWQWTHQALHGRHQGFKICHDILRGLSQACIYGQQIPGAAILSGSSAQ